jgi:non-ribosomal peptide synthetase component F
MEEKIQNFRRESSSAPRQTASERVALLNLYGPTETTIYSTGGEVTQEDDVITIGRPILNTQIHILDAHLQPVPIGVAGELYIGGEGLANGYLGRPELTSERFVKNPFSEFPGARLYRSGDLARYRPDGRIEFLGRMDRQVKIRGFRIELGEIEAVLAEHSDVLQAVVVARQNERSDKDLVAYIKVRRSKVSLEELRKFLRSRLPAYMIPSVLFRWTSYL